MSKEKKKWESPKLICLYRGRPEEAVLGYCKITAGPGPDSGTRCQKDEQTSTCKSAIGT